MDKPDHPIVKLQMTSLSHFQRFQLVFSSPFLIMDRNLRIAWYLWEASNMKEVRTNKKERNLEQSGIMLRKESLTEKSC